MDLARQKPNALDPDLVNQKDVPHEYAPSQVQQAPYLLAMIRKFSFACFFLLAGSILHGQTNEARVLVIGIDGLRSDCLEAANTPALDGLIADGVYSPDALNNDITYSGPGWSGMICGVWSDKHGVTGNNFVGSDFEAYPSFMRRLELANSDLNTFSICHWTPINDYILGEDVDEGINVSTDAAVRDGAVSIFENGDPHAMFLHFDDVDINGHGYGFNANVSEYMNAIEATDQFISDILVALTSRPNYANENWLTLVSTDHGGIGFNHGGTSIQEETIFFIASGNAVSNNVFVKDTLESCPLLKIASLLMPQNCNLVATATLWSLKITRRSNSARIKTSPSKFGFEPKPRQMWPF